MLQTLMRRRNVGTICFSILLIMLLVAPLATEAMLRENPANRRSLSQVSFALSGSPAYQVVVTPVRLQEGFNATITVEARDLTANATVNVNVTAPTGVPPYVQTLQITINGTGFGSNSTKYWGNFTGGANTNYVGLYTISVNETLATANFTVGLTDRREYRRTETVSIRAVGYKPSENLTISLKSESDNASIPGYPKTLPVDVNGILNHNWTIPSGATLGTYRVSLVSPTLETVKTPADEDTFRVLGAVCSVKTVNLANQTVSGAVVEVYNATTHKYLNLKATTNSSGWARFGLDVGNYTFKAFVQNVTVADPFNQTVTVDDTSIIMQPLRLRLVNVVATVETEVGKRVPFIDIALECNLTTRDNITMSETASMRTNLTGVAEVQNLFTNTIYRVDARRYDALFSSTTLAVESLPVSPWISVNLTLPTYRLDVHALDSKDTPAVGFQIRVYEWTSGVTTPLQSLETSSSGDASFLLPFGRYRLRAYSSDAFLDETVVNLVENPFGFTFNLVMVNVDVTVSVLDYFGQPLANANVTIEHKIGQEYVFACGQFTGAGGSTTFASIVGGDSRISAYVGGRLTGVATQFLGAGSSQVVIRAEEYVAILGYPVETGLFALFSFILVLVVAVLVLARGRLMKVLGKRLKR